MAALSSSAFATKVVVNSTASAGENRNRGCVARPEQRISMSRKRFPHDQRLGPRVELSVYDLGPLGFWKLVVEAT